MSAQGQKPTSSALPGLVPVYLRKPTSDAHVGMSEMGHKRMLNYLGETTQISQRRCMQAGWWSAGRLLTSTGSARHLSQQSTSTGMWTTSPKYHRGQGYTRFFSRQGRTKACGCNRSTNRSRRCEQEFHKEKTAFKDPLIKSYVMNRALLFARGCGPAVDMQWRYLVWWGRIRCWFNAGTTRVAQGPAIPDRIGRAWCLLRVISRRLNEAYSKSGLTSEADIDGVSPLGLLWAARRGHRYAIWLLP